jgi:hypothetical protein
MKSSALGVRHPPSVPPSHTTQLACRRRDRAQNLSRRRHSGAPESFQRMQPQLKRHLVLCQPRSDKGQNAGLAQACRYQLFVIPPDLEAEHLFLVSMGPSRRRVLQKVDREGGSFQSACDFLIQILTPSGHVRSFLWRRDVACLSASWLERTVRTTGG